MCTRDGIVDLVIMFLYAQENYDLFSLKYKLRYYHSRTIILALIRKKRGWGVHKNVGNTNPFGGSLPVLSGLFDPVLVGLVGLVMSSVILRFRHFSSRKKKYR